MKKSQILSTFSRSRSLMIVMISAGGTPLCTRAEAICRNWNSRCLSVVGRSPLNGRLIVLGGSAR